MIDLTAQGRKTSGDATTLINTSGTIKTEGGYTFVVFYRYGDGFLVNLNKAASSNKNPILLGDKLRISGAFFEVKDTARFPTAYGIINGYLLMPTVAPDLPPANTVPELNGNPAAIPGVVLESETGNYTVVGNTQDGTPIVVNEGVPVSALQAQLLIEGNASGGNYLEPMSIDQLNTPSAVDVTETEVVTPAKKSILPLVAGAATLYFLGN